VSSYNSCTIVGMIVRCMIKSISVRDCISSVCIWKEDVGELATQAILLVVLSPSSVQY